MGLLASPRLIAALALALLVAGLTAWALFERAGKLACRVDVEKLTGQIAVLGAQIETQNAAVVEWQQKAQEARQKGAQAAKVAKGATDAHSALLKALDSRIAAPEGKSCSDAMTEIRAQR